MKKRLIKTERKIFYKPSLSERIMNHWHKIFFTSLVFLLIGKILGNVFKVAMWRKNFFIGEMVFGVLVTL